MLPKGWPSRWHFSSCPINVTRIGFRSFAHFQYLSPFIFFFSPRLVNNFISLNRKKCILPISKKKKNQRTFCRRWPGTARVCKVSSERRDAGDNHELDMAEEENAEGGGFGLDLQVINIARRGSVFKVPNPSGSLITIWWGLCGLDFVDASFLGQSFGESSTEALFNLDRTHLIERPPESLGFGVLNSGPSRLYQERPHRFMPSLTRAPRHPYRLLLLSPPSSGHLSICCWNWKQIRSQIVCEVLDDIVSVVIDFPIGFKL